MIRFASLCGTLRLVIITSVLSVFAALPQKSAAFDVWTFLADLPGPAKATLNAYIDPVSVEMILGAKTVFESCQDFSEPGIIKCIDTLNNDPTFANMVGSDATGGIEKALAIYIKVRNDDYLGLIDEVGKPIACILASMIAGGFPVCSALDLLLELGSAMGDAVVAFFSAIGEGLESACEWVGLCEADGKQVSVAEFMYTLLKPRVDEGLAARMQPSTTPWFDLLKKYRAELANTMKAHYPTEADFTKAFAGYLADIIPKWNAKVNGYENIEKLHGIAKKYYDDNELRLLKLVHNAPSSGDVQLRIRDDGKVARKQFDDFKLYDILAAESPGGKPADPFQWADSGMYSDGAKVAQAYREAVKTGCTATAKPKEFTLLTCAAPSAMTECAEYLAAINQIHKGAAKPTDVCKFNKFTADTQAEAKACAAAVNKMNAVSPGAVNADDVCVLDIDALRKAILAKMKSLDPSGYCAANGSTVVCARDVPHAKVCKATLATEVAPFVSGLTCQLQRSASYQSLVNQAQPALQKTKAVLSNWAKLQITQINSATSNPQFHISPAIANALVPPVEASIDSLDPLLINAIIFTDASSFDALAAKLRSGTGLPAPDASDPDNGGHNAIALKITRGAKPMSNEERDLLERIIKGVAVATIGVGPKPNLGSIAAGVANPVINPIDFSRFGMALQRVMGMPAMAGRLSGAELGALRDGLVGTANPKVFKANTPAAAAAFAKVQAAAPQEGLQLQR